MHRSVHTTVPAIGKVAPQLSQPSPQSTRHMATCFFFSSFLCTLHRRQPYCSIFFFPFLSVHHKSTLPVRAWQQFKPNRQAPLEMQVPLSVAYTLVTIGKAHTTAFAGLHILKLAYMAFLYRSLRSGSFQLLTKHCTQQSHVSEYWGALIISRGIFSDGTSQFYDVHAVELVYPIIHKRLLLYPVSMHPIFAH